MKNVDIFSENFRPHFVGVGGISMSGLAKYFLVRGIKVSGSDRENSFETEKLKKLGAKINVPHDGKNIAESNAVIYTSAIVKDNPELKEAERQKIPLIKRSEILGGILKSFSKSVCVAGSHGKTTATAMIAETLIKAGKSPTVFLGGESREFGNFRSGKDGVAVAEACEYKKNFLDISPDIAVVLNIDDDHPDTYPTVNEETAAFSQFVKNALAVVNADDRNAASVAGLSSVTFGISRPAVYRAKRIVRKDNGYAFTLYVYGVKKERINLSVFGRHNVYNALAAIAVCDLLKVPIKDIKSGIESFCGVKRRNEFLGTYKNARLYADYAHHPTEISATIAEFCERNIRTLCVFQPHTYSRTKKLLPAFISALSKADGVIVYKTYPARENFDMAGDAETLYDKLKAAYNKDCFYSGDPETLKKLIDLEVKNYDAVAFIGAGDVYFVAKNNFLKKNEEKF